MYCFRYLQQKVIYKGNLTLTLERQKRASEPEACFQAYHYSFGPESQEVPGASLTLIRKLGNQC